MLSLVTALLVATSLAATLPATSNLSQTAKPTPTGASPLSPDAAAKIFESGNLHTVSQLASNLITVKSTPPPAANGAFVIPTVVGVPAPSGTNIPQSIAPRVPSSGKIQVKPAENVPIANVVGNNQSHVPRELLGSRAACQGYPFCCPDPRYLNENPGYPYSTIGRISSPGGDCTGTLVGPKEVLTAGSCIKWLVCRTTFDGPLTFQVDYWPGNGGSATFYANKVAYYDAAACGEPTTWTEVAIDYVVITLTEDTGLPYMGVKAYNPAWNGPSYWYEQGYAADAGGSLYPYFQGPFPVTSAVTEGFGELLEYAACGTPGDYGSPVFAWWSDGPYIVGLMTETSGPAVWGPAGQAIINLIADQGN